MKQSERLRIMAKNGYKFKLPKDVPINVLVFCEGKLLRPYNHKLKNGDYEIKNNSIEILRSWQPVTNSMLIDLTLIDIINGSRWVLNNDELRWMRI
jgi:hypothetical protein